MITISDIKNLTTEELNNMNANEVKTYLQRASTIAKSRRTRTINQMEKFGVEAGIYAENPKGYQNTSYRNTDFDYNPADNISKMKHKLRTIQRFLNDKTSTWEGIRNVYGNFTNYLTAISGKNGENVKKKLADIERNGAREGLTEKQIKRQQNIYLKREANKALKIRDAAKRANIFDNKKAVRKFWNTYNKIRETFKKEIYSSDQVKEIIYDEVTKDLRVGADTLVNRVSERLRGEYEREEAEWSELSNFDNFFDYEE